MRKEGTGPAIITNARPLHIRAESRLLQIVDHRHLIALPSFLVPDTETHQRLPFG